MRLFEKDNFWIGLAVGVAVPFVGYALLLTVFEQLESAGILSPEGFSVNFRQRTLGIVAICLNIISVNLFQRNKATNSVRAVATATIVYVFVWLIIFGKDLFS